MNKNILITGGAGFIGSHVCYLFRQKGYIPISFDNFTNGYREAVRYGPVHEGDLLNLEQLRKCMEMYRPFAVCHLAAITSVEESNQNPLLYYQNNVAGTLNLLQVMSEFKIQKLIFSSSSSIYSPHQNNIYGEESPIVPQHPYAKSKAIIESILLEDKSSLHINSVILRYSNVAGASHQEGLGEKSDSFRIVPNLIKSIISGNSIHVYANNPLTVDGTCVRDYVHVKEVAQSNLLALEYLFEGGATEYFNISSGHGHSVLDLIQITNEIFSCQLPFKLLDRRSGDIPKIICNNDKAKRILGWTPRLQVKDMIYDHYCFEKNKIKGLLGAA